MSASATLQDLSAGFRGPALRARCLAAGLHLALSAALALGLSFAMVSALYPEPYFHASGGAALLTLIVAVDVVMGPALTFVVFDRRKASLRADLAVIAALQLAALGYGLYATAMGRPVFQTFVVDRFELVSAAEVDPAELVRAPAELRELGWHGPLLAAARRPDDPAERETLIFAAASGVDLRHLMRHYVRYEQQREQVLAAARPLAALAEFNEPARIDQALSRLAAGPTERQTLRWLPVSGPREDLVALVDGRTAELRGVVRLAPWKTR